MEIFPSFKSNFLPFVVFERFLSCECQLPSHSSTLDLKPSISESAYEGENGVCVCENSFFKFLILRLQEKVFYREFKGHAFSTWICKCGYNGIPSELGAGFRSLLSVKMPLGEPPLLNGVKQEVLVWEGQEAGGQELLQHISKTECTWVVSSSRI